MQLIVNASYTNLVADLAIPAQYQQKCCILIFICKVFG